MKDFIIIGNFNAVTYKEVFPLVKENKIWPGNQNVKEFCSQNGEIKKFGNILWYTNIQHKKRNTPLDLYKRYSDEYPKYDNYNAIEVGKTCDIPMDYDGVMGVPITFLDKYCPAQFEIVDARTCAYNDKQKNKSTYLIKDADGSINGKPTYARICIKRRNYPLDLYKRYSNEYPKYDNYDAIEVSKVSDIPMDYDGVMGVPITFLDSYCPEQFEIVGIMANTKNDGKTFFGYPYIDGKKCFARLLIKRRGQ